jgi:hypothetical protein
VRGLDVQFGGGGTELPACPRAGVVGTCTMNVSGYSYTSYFYAGGVTADIVKSVCPGGVYTPGAPRALTTGE